MDASSEISPEHFGLTTHAFLNEYPELIDKEIVYGCFNVKDLDLQELVEQLAKLLDVIEANGTLQELDGSYETSRRDPNSPPSRLQFLLGTKIEEFLPQLYLLYESFIPQIFYNVYSKQIYPDPERSTGAYAQSLLAASGYEPHVDANPLTFLAFPYDHSSGGELVLRVGDTEVAIRPTSGMVLLLDLREVVHWVNPIIQHAFGDRPPRTSFVGNLYDKPEARQPEEIIKYLIGDPHGSTKPEL